MIIFRYSGKILLFESTTISLFKSNGLILFKNDKDFFVLFILVLNETFQLNV